MGQQRSQIGQIYIAVGVGVAVKGRRAAGSAKVGQQRGEVVQIHIGIGVEIGGAALFECADIAGCATNRARHTGAWRGEFAGDVVGGQDSGYEGRGGVNAGGSSDGVQI